MRCRQFGPPPRVYETDQFGDEYSAWWPKPLLQSHPVAIYGLRSNAGGLFHYAGSSYLPRVRLRAHWCARESNFDEKAQWLAVLAERGERPVLVVLEMTTHGRREELERRWIRFLRENGHPLTNRRDW